MANEPKVPVTPEPITQARAKTQLLSVPMKDLPNPAEHEDEFSHRLAGKLKEDALEDVIESLKLDRQLEPVQVAKRKDGKWEIICGHRRLAAMYILALKGMPGFSLDMAVQCLEVLNASHLALLKRSIADNELAKKLDQKERLLAVKKLQEAGATKKEIAVTLGVSEKSIEPDLRIVKYPRVLRHVLDDNLPPTAAAALVEVAVTKGRLDEFLDYFDIWVQLTKEQIGEEDRRAKQEHGKGLKPNQVLVMNRLESHLVRGWIEALAKGRPLTEEADLGFEASFDMKTAQATIKVKIDARTDDVDHLARVAGQVSLVAKQLAAFAQTRRALEGPSGPQAALKDDTFLDLDLLKEFGLQDIAVQLEREMKADDKSSVEADATEAPGGATAGK